MPLADEPDILDEAREELDAVDEADASSVGSVEELEHAFAAVEQASAEAPKGQR